MHCRRVIFGMAGGDQELLSSFCKLAAEMFMYTLLQITIQPTVGKGHLSGLKTAAFE